MHDETVWRAAQRRVRELERGPAGAPPRRRRRLRRAARGVGRRSRPLLGRGRRAISASRSHEPYAQVLDESARAGVAALVRRRSPQPGERVRRALRRRSRAARAARRSSGRARRATTRRWTYAELAREIARLAEGLEDLGVAPGRRRRAAAADGARGRGRALRRRLARRARRADLLGLLGSRRREPAGRLGRDRADHVRRVPAPRAARRRRRRPRTARPPTLPALRHVVVLRRLGERGAVAGRAATSGTTISSPTVPASGARRRSRASTPFCSATRRARPAGPRAPCTCTAGCSSSSRRESRLHRRPRARTIACTGRPISAGSWGPGC